MIKKIQKRDGMKKHFTHITPDCAFCEHATLAEETEPTWAYVAIYDDHGRFVEVKIGEIVDGKAEVTFTDNRIGDLNVFFLGENKTPLLNALTF